MFTGIVEERGKVVALDHLGDAARLTVSGAMVTSDAEPGDSISVNGCCLTVVAHGDGSFTADVTAESLDRTALGALVPGSEVNLERAVPVTGRLGGHLVQGHVDGTTTLLERRPSQNWEVLGFALPDALARYLAPKGSIAVDGVSLTVVDLVAAIDGQPGMFTVSLVPTTLSATTLGGLAPGDQVNLEVDVVAKYVERMLATGSLPPASTGGSHMNPVEWLFDAELVIGDSTILWREIVGNLFGLASAVGGMRRRVWAWPVGIVGNVLLFTVFLGAVFNTPQDQNLWGQAGRQIFFVALSVWGWYRWRQAARSNAQPGARNQPAIRPRWATWGERAQLLVLYAVGTAFFWWLFGIIGSYGRLTEAWILTGSMLATYGMARGWVEFWLVWIAVDAVGVPTLLRAELYPSATLYAVYGAFVIWGFVVWLRVARNEGPHGIDDPATETVGA